MNKFKIQLADIQHIKSLEYEIDLSKNALHCIVGKNGVGKTTLIRAIENFKDSTILDKSSIVNIIKDSSKLIYTIDGDSFTLKPMLDDGRYILNTWQELNQDIKDNIYTELPIPKGKRFDAFSKLGGAIGEKIKSAFATNNYVVDGYVADGYFAKNTTKPDKLIKLLNRIYESKDRFDDLEQVDIGSDKYYIKPLNDENYIREDNFSSGEYMIMQIYKLVESRCKLIVIDELDISLDCSAQVNLIKELRNLSEKYEINIVFTTHSLAIMKVMHDDELYYMEDIDSKTIIEKKSYSFIKSLMFGFQGYDKVILTEDKMLQEYLKDILHGVVGLSKYEIIYIAGASQVVDLMKRNKLLNFFNTQEVISFLDGDKLSDYSDEDKVLFLPFTSIEKEIFRLYKDNQLDFQVSSKDLLDEKLNKLKPNGNELGEKAKAKIVVDNVKFSDIQCIDFINTITENQLKTSLIKEEIIEFLKL